MQEVAGEPRQCYEGALIGYLGKRGSCWQLLVAMGVLHLLQMGYIVIQGPPLSLAAIEEVPQKHVVKLQALGLRHSHLEDIAFPEMGGQILQALSAPAQDHLMSTKLYLLHDVKVVMRGQALQTAH